MVQNWSIKLLKLLHNSSGFLYISHIWNRYNKLIKTIEAAPVLEQPLSDQ